MVRADDGTSGRANVRGKRLGLSSHPDKSVPPNDVRAAMRIYSFFGCTLYYAITGKVPFPSWRSRSSANGHLSETPWDPRGNFAPLN